MELGRILIRQRLHLQLSRPAAEYRALFAEDFFSKEDLLHKRQKAGRKCPGGGLDKWVRIGYNNVW